MNKTEVINQLIEVGIVPVVRAQSSQDALRAAAAIMAGGVPVIEITMTVPGAIQTIAEVANEYGNEVLVGAGTVLDAETARACILAGAQFVVSPSLHPDVITMCHRYGRVAIPGALTQIGRVHV